MNKIIALLLIVTQTAYAGLPPTSVQGQSDASAQTKFAFQVPYSQKTDLGGVKALFETGNKNLLANGSFENVTATTSWTTTKLTGTTFTSAVDTTNYVDGKQSLAGTLTAATGEISQDVTPAIQTNGVPMVASCRVKTAATDVQVCARTNGTDISCTTVSSANNWVIQSVNFTGPANGTSVGVSVKNTTSNTESFNMDDCYVGVSSTPQNFGQISQATLYGQVKITGCAGAWTTTSTSFAAYSVQTGCVYTASGNASAPATMIPAITFSQLPPGNYLLKYEGTAGTVYSSAAGAAEFQFYDGTNTANEVSYQGNPASGTPDYGPGFAQTIAYTTAQSNITLQIRGLTSNAGSTNTIYGQTALPGVISVWRFPSSTELAYRPDVLPASYNGTLVGAGGGWTTTSTSYANYSVATTSTTLTQIAAVNMSCVAEATKLPGVTCTLPRSGRYQVCATWTANATGAGGVVAGRIVDSSGTVINGGVWSNTPVSAYNMPFSMCGQYNATSVTSPITFEVQGAVSGSSTETIVEGATSPITFSIIGTDNSLPAPLLSGSVTSNSTGQEHVERAHVGNSTGTDAAPVACSASPCTIYSQSGSWITGVTRTSAGLYTVTIATGEFSGIPSCQFLTGSSAAAIGSVTLSSAPTATSYVPSFKNLSNTAQDVDFWINCQGPR